MSSSMSSTSPTTISPPPTPTSSSSARLNNNNNNNTNYSNNNNNNNNHHHQQYHKIHNKDNNNNNSNQTISMKLEERDEFVHRFEAWSSQDQVEFVERLLGKMAHCQHRRIDEALQSLLERDFMHLVYQNNSNNNNNDLDNNNNNTNSQIQNNNNVITSCNDSGGGGLNSNNNNNNGSGRGSRNSSASASPSLGGHSSMSTPSGSPMQQLASSGFNQAANLNSLNGLNSTQFVAAAAAAAAAAATSGNQHQLQQDQQQQSPMAMMAAASQFLSLFRSVQASQQAGAGGLLGAGQDLDLSAAAAQSQLLANTLSAAANVSSSDVATNLTNHLAKQQLHHQQANNSHHTLNNLQHHLQQQHNHHNQATNNNSTGINTTNNINQRSVNSNHQFNLTGSNLSSASVTPSNQSSAAAATAAVAAQLSAVAAAAASLASNRNNNGAITGGGVGSLTNQSGAVVHSIPHPHSHHALSHPAASLLINNSHFQTVRTKYSTRRYSRRRVGPEEAMADPAIRATVQLKMPVVQKTILIVLKHRLTVQTAITLACQHTGDRLRKGAIQKKLEAMFREPNAVETFLAEWDQTR